MKDQPLEREAIFPRIDGIRKNIQKLESLGKLPLAEFSVGDSFDLAQHHLRLALEGIFNISTHILSRMPGGRAVEYKEIALKMGELKVVPTDFAKRALVPMAGLRNILVHHYSDIKPAKIYEIIQKHLTDMETFLEYIKTFLENLKKFNLKMS